MGLAIHGEARIVDRVDVTFQGEDPTPDEVRGYNGTTYTGEDAAQLRKEVDEDGDGTVERKERFAYLNKLKQRWRETPPELGWTLDGQPASEPKHADVKVDNLRGPVESPDEASIVIWFNTTFPNVSHGDEHVLVVSEFEHCRGADGKHAPRRGWSSRWLTTRSPTGTSKPPAPSATTSSKPRAWRPRRLRSRSRSRRYRARVADRRTALPATG